MSALLVVEVLLLKIYLRIVAVGVPAKVIKTGIQMDEHARLIGKFKYKE